MLVCVFPLKPKVSYASFYERKHRFGLEMKWSEILQDDKFLIKPLSMTMICCFENGVRKDIENLALGLMRKYMEMSKPYTMLLYLGSVVHANILYNVVIFIL